jgi:hypothetical protein
MKFKLSALRPLTLGLMLLSMALTVIVIVRAWHGTEARSLLATPAREYAAPSAKLALPASPARVAIRDRALLHASREFFVPPTPVAASATPPRPDYRLVGTFVIPHKPTIALLMSSSGASRKVKPGDELDGWLVRAVETRRVILQYGNESAEIMAAAKSASSGLTTAPLSRKTLSTPLPPAQGGAPESPGIPLPDQTAGTVTVLGAGATPGKPASGGMREASAAGTNPLRTDARLYRPPPQ